MRLRSPLLAATLLAMGIALHPTSAPLATTPSVSDLLKQAEREFETFHFAASESLAVVARDRLEREPRPDAVLLGDAYLRIAQARLENGALSDSVAYRSIVRALELYQSKLPAGDLKLADASAEMGFLLNQTRRSVEALPYQQRALEIKRAKLGESSLFTATAWFNVGTTYRRLGQLDSALVAFQHNLDIHQSAETPSGHSVGAAQVEIANVRELQGDTDGARQGYQQGLHTLEAALDPMHPRIGYALNRYAGFAFRTGDYALCIDLMQRAVALSEARLGPEARDTQLFWANIAQALGQIGDYPRVLQIIARVLPQFEASFGPSHSFVTGLQRDRAYALAATGDTLAALAQFRATQAVLEADSTANDSGDLTSCLFAQAQLLEGTGDLRGALDLARQAMRAERSRPASKGVDVASILTLQLMDHARLGEWAQADSADAALQAVIEESHLEQDNSYESILTARSGVAALRGRPDDALRLAEEATHRSRAQLLQNVRALSDRQALLLSGSLSAPLQRLLQVATLPGAPRRAASVAWDELVRTRGLVRGEIARRRPPALVPAGAAVDTALVSAHAAWVRAQRRLAQFEVSIAGADRDAESDARNAELRAGAEEAERRWLRLSSAQAPPGALAPDSVGLAQVRAALPDGAALVSLATVRREGERADRMLAFVARAGRDDVRVIELGPAPAIQAQLGKWLRQLAASPAGDAGAEQAARAQGERVRKLTWDVLSPALRGARDVYLVPDEQLSAIPWAALPVGRSAYLVETGPQLHVLNAERELLRAPAAATRGLLALGGVDFDGASSPAPPQMLLAASTRALFVDCGDAALTSLGPLPGTAAEVAAVQQAWSRGGIGPAGDALVLQGPGATEAVFKQQSAGRTVIHLATHGITLSDTCGTAARRAARAREGERARGVGGVEALVPSAHANADVSPDASADASAHTSPHAGTTATALSSPWMGRRVLLALAGANHAREHDRDENEGLLTAEEVTTLDLRTAEWVVLSACQSGLGDRWASDGLLGMRRAFHLAGARTVIASQWSVDDESTREWMTALYEARTQGAHTAAAAMQQASRAVLKARRASGRGTHPFYWAAFTASGE